MVTEMYKCKSYQAVHLYIYMFVLYIYKPFVLCIYNICFLYICTHPHTYIYMYLKYIYFHDNTTHIHTLHVSESVFLKNGGGWVLKELFEMFFL